MHRFLTALTLSVVVAGAAMAANWPQWRGPNANSVAPPGKYPTKWSSTQNVAWKYPLPGRGASTPAIWGDHIFVTTGSAGKNLLLCLDRKGKKRWSLAFGNEIAGRNRKASGSNPSPITDGKYVYIYFKTGDVICVDFNGKAIWRRNLQKLYGDDVLGWDLGTSPILTKKHLIVAVMHRDPSYLVALDRRTGKVAWKVNRSLPAPGESNDSYTTPALITANGKETIITLGADHVTAHDAANGRELWRVGGLNPFGRGNFRAIASPAYWGGIVIAPYARGGSMTAIRLGGKGDVTRSHVLWTKTGRGYAADVPTPIAVNGKVFNCSDRGRIVCMDLKTGKEIWSGQVERHRSAYSSSPVIAGNYIYVTREDGMTFVVSLDGKFRIVGQNLLDEFTVASPVFVDGQILIRTYNNLYMIGKK